VTYFEQKKNCVFLEVDNDFLNSAICTT